MKHRGLENVPVVFNKKDSPVLFLKLNLFLKMNTSMQDNPRRKKRVSHWRVPGYTQNTVRGGKTDLTVEDQDKVSEYSITKSWCQYKGNTGLGVLVKWA